MPRDGPTRGPSRQARPPAFSDPRTAWSSAPKAPNPIPLLEHSPFPPDGRQARVRARAPRPMGDPWISLSVSIAFIPAGEPRGRLPGACEERAASDPAREAGGERDGGGVGPRPAECRGGCVAESRDRGPAPPPRGGRGQVLGVA